MLALRAALAIADTDAGSLLLAHQRLSDVLDAVLQYSVEAYVAETQAALSARATRDALTGLLNRAAFDEALDHECASAERADPPALLLLDLDGFKGVNDTLGHLAGDDVLATVAAILTRAVRRCDVVARLGGDEFAVMMPRTAARQAMNLAERLVRTMQRSRALDLPGAPTRVGVSIGVACLTTPGACGAGRGGGCGHVRGQARWQGSRVPVPPDSGGRVTRAASDTGFRFDPVLVAQARAGSQIARRRLRRRTRTAAYPLALSLTGRPVAAARAVRLALDDALGADGGDYTGTVVAAVHTRALALTAGSPEDEGRRSRAALQLCDRGGLSQAAAARLLGLTRQQLAASPCPWTCRPRRRSSS